MSLRNIVTSKLLPSLITAITLSITVGCTTTPNTVQESALTPSESVLTPASTEPEQVCATDDCDESEDGVNRYKYYLGILSVFLMG